MKQLLLGLLAVGLIACGPAHQAEISTDGRLSSIIGGVEVTDQDLFAKSTVAVIDIFQGGVCTGTIISENVVVTAAHCVQSGASFLQVGFGLDLEKAKRVALEKSTFNERYAQAMAELEGILQAIVEATVPGTERQAKIYAALDDYKNWGDIALLKIKGKIPEGYAPAEVLEDGRQIQNGGTILLAGYGITKPYSEQQSGDSEPTVLRKVEIKVHNAVYSDTEVSFDQTEGKGACHGDSGGPAYVKVGEKLKLFGVTSRGLADPEDSCRKYSGYTYVPAFKSWMEGTITEWAKAPEAPKEEPKKEEPAQPAKTKEAPEQKDAHVVVSKR